MTSINELVGKTLTHVINDNDDVITFITNNGRVYHMLHEQECCERVTIDDIDGDLQNLIGVPIITAEEVSNDDFVTEHRNSFKLDEERGDYINNKGEWMPESCTWTFYKIATIKGYVTIRWYGESNGYYSESVQFKRAGIFSSEN